MNREKYQLFDRSTNIIIASKTGTYTPYKATRFPLNKSSYKRIDPINIKLFDKPKRPQKILSRNDRIDLYLQGGQVSELKRNSSKSINTDYDRTFYKICKVKRKGDIVNTLDPKVKTNGWATKPTFHQGSEELDHTQIKISQMGLRQNTREKNRNSMEEIKKVHVNGSLNKKQPANISNRKKRQPVKSSLNSLEVEEVKIAILKNRPLFYLQAKQFSHIKADSFLVMEYPSSQIIFGNYYKKIAEIASLTKIMTFYTVFSIAQEYKKSLSKELVIIDEEAQAMTGTSAQVYMGDIFTVQQLLYGLMLPSGNDAATALAKWGGQILLDNEAGTKSQGNESNKGCVKRFIQQMNSITKKLNLKSTKFGNPHGLPHSQSGSNPQDIALLICECLKIELFMKVVKTKRYSCWISDTEDIRREVLWENTNKLLRRPGFIGVKTGVTITAGPCLATCYQSGEKIFIVMLLRTTKLSRRFKETRWILGLALSKLNKMKYQNEIKAILKNDDELDSDNSEDEDQFNYERSDAKQMKKRNKILTFEM